MIDAFLIIPKVCLYLSSHPLPYLYHLLTCFACYSHISHCALNLNPPSFVNTKLQNHIWQYYAKLRDLKFVCMFGLIPCLICIIYRLVLLAINFNVP